MKAFLVFSVICVGISISANAQHSGSISFEEKVDARFTFSAAVRMIENANYRDSSIAGCFHEVPAPDCPIVSRKQWGARTPRNPMTPLDPAQVEGVVIHHAAMPMNEDWIHKVESLHVDVRKWDAIGYNYLIGLDKEGNCKVFEGRGHYVGAHAAGHNKRMIGILFMGNYHPASINNPSGYLESDPESRRQPPRECIQKAGELIAGLKHKYRLLTKVHGHGLGDHAIVGGHTLCPGEGCLHIVDAFKTKFEKREGWK